MRHAESVRHVSAALEKAEGGCITDRAFDSAQGAVGKFQGHEGIWGKRAFQHAGFVWGEAEAGVVVCVSEHENDSFAPLAEFGQAAADQLAANGLDLVCGQDGHGGQGNGWYGAVLGFDGHAGEEDVADDFVV